MSNEPPPLKRTARSKFENKSQNDRWHPWHLAGQIDSKSREMHSSGGLPARGLFESEAPYGVISPLIIPVTWDRWLVN